MLQNNTDCRISVYNADAKVKLVLANVTDTAKALERTHLCGPVAGLMQADGVAAVALIGEMLTNPDEVVCLRSKFPEGLLKGITMECSQTGNIRGFTERKVIDELDSLPIDEENAVETKAFGREAQTLILRSGANGEISRACFPTFDNEFITLTDVLCDYYNNSLQSHLTLLQLASFSKDGYIRQSRGLLLDCMPDADERLFGHYDAMFSSDAVQDLLDAGANVEEFIKLFKWTSNNIISESPINFKCKCSSLRINSMLAALPDKDLQEMIEKGEPTDIFCHFCGKNYSVSVAALKMIKDSRK